MSYERQVRTKRSYRRDKEIGLHQRQVRARSGQRGVKDIGMSGRYQAGRHEQRHSSQHDQAIDHYTSAQHGRYLLRGLHDNQIDP